MAIGLIGKKIGMTREFFDSGISVPVTVLSVEKGRILDVITKEKRGYDAIKVGFGKIKNSKLTKQMKGVFAKKSTEPKKVLKEFRVLEENEPSNLLIRQAYTEVFNQELEEARLREAFNRIKISDIIIKNAPPLFEIRD